jgi:hypothetical protein
VQGRRIILFPFLIWAPLWSKWTLPRLLGVLALIIANIHWQKLVMHQMTIFVPEPL